MCICTTNSAVKFSWHSRTLRRFTAPHNLNPSCHLSPADFKLGAHIPQNMAGVRHAYNTFISKKLWVRSGEHCKPRRVIKTTNFVQTVTQQHYLKNMSNNYFCRRNRIRVSV